VCTTRRSLQDLCINMHCSKNAHVMYRTYAHLKQVLCIKCTPTYNLYKAYAVTCIPQNSYHVIHRRCIHLQHHVCLSCTPPSSLYKIYTVICIGKKDIKRDAYEVCTPQAQSVHSEDDIFIRCKGGVHTSSRWCGRCAANVRQLPYHTSPM
jgi:hypothetical protein